ncbi:hypothetical protein Ppa06_57230 [Planomonospora parontospora subsp. parontospora]|uniref:Uncharacterized protein n=2 Tax=Planomonospora parontospora TaxID=58119 RepID=A0AA37BLM3_9ACTN|nr:DUF6461 domain-containing protein [Planomonospora parontospora]GGK91003.1 hypothetical protein GCM10010126_58070 [Planomonospora parontospora]GII11925.1 hypothetical protein Ppa06_57230 [Planomonospora parontospora subsp. parontospora]
MESIDARYTRLIQEGLPDNLCLTWCQSDDLEDIARKFGADVETGLWATIDEIEEMEQEDDEAVLLELDSMGDWAIAFEPNGIEGSRKAVMESVSIGGCAFSIFWNVELDSSVIYAVDGRIVTSFTLLEIERRSGSDPAALDEMLTEIELNDGLSMPARKARLLALGEMISGQRLTSEWLRSPKFIFQINDPIPDPIIPREYLNPRAPFLDDPEFMLILERLSVEVAPHIARMVASIVAAAVLPDSPLAKDVLRFLHQGERFKGEREALQAQLERTSQEISRTDSLQGELSSEARKEMHNRQIASHALSVLARSLNPYSVNAAYGAAAEAVNLPLLPRVDFMRLEVLWNVAKHIERSRYSVER